MEFLPILATLAGMHLLMAMLPGPNTILVSWLAAARSRRDGLRAVAGVVTATLVWVVLSLWGFGTFLLEAGWLYRLLRLLGALYLIWLGIGMLRASLRRRSAAVALEPPPLAGRDPFMAGLSTTLGNPKSAVFWTSAFLVAVPPHAPAWVHLAIVAIVAVQSTLWYGAVALMLATGPARRLYRQASRWLDRLAGTVMVLLGLRLADEIRRELQAEALVRAG